MSAARQTLVLAALLLGIIASVGTSAVVALLLPMPWNIVACIASAVAFAAGNAWLCLRALERWS